MVILPSYKPLREENGPPVVGKYWGGLIDVVHESGRIAYAEVFWTVVYMIFSIMLCLAFGGYIYITKGGLLLLLTPLLLDVIITFSMLHGLRNKNYRYLIPTVFWYSILVGLTIAVCVLCILMSAYFILATRLQLPESLKKDMARFVTNSIGDVYLKNFHEVLEDFGRFAIACVASVIFLLSAAYLRRAYWNFKILYECMRYFKRLGASGRRV
uniref:MARVEL domain-containing protein n=1 Tax=Steinernema glaseri TaxID=37863 RepID=A0A1I7ZH15_9BILA